MSSSSSAFPGRIVLINPHLPQLDLSQLTDKLVHEAIHSLLYAVEVEHPLVRDRALADGVYVVSPWTGTTLGFYSYLHACFVWYALWCFWSQAAVASVFPDADVDGHVRRARVGFTRGPLGARVPDWSRIVVPVVEDLVEVFRETVQADDRVALDS